MTHLSAPRRTLATALLGLALGAGLSACGRGDALDDAELAVGEASAYLTVSEESGDVGADALVEASDADLGALAQEDADTAAGDVLDDGSPCDFSARRQQVLARYDLDGDGRLSREELRQLRADLGEGLRPQRWALGARVRSGAFWRVRWAFDEDASRSLSAEERAALVDAVEARCERLRAQRLERFDADGSGTLEPAEREAAREAARARWQQWRAALLARYDADGSGTLDETERAQLRADRLAAAAARRAALVAQYDTDGDGRLSTAEALPLRQALQRRIIEGKDAEPGEP